MSPPNAEPPRSAPARADPRLIDVTGRIFDLDRNSTVIGRRGADIAFVDSTVAARQARVVFAKDRFILEDLAGNTLLNGKRVERTPVLRNGDQIGVGRRVLRVEGMPSVAEVPSPQKHNPSARAWHPAQRELTPDEDVTARNAAPVVLARAIAVTEAGYDDIGAVLRRLGPGFGHTEIDLGAAVDSLARYSVLFINCAQRPSADPAAVAPALERFVHGGGALYASDWASAYIAAAFPGMLNFAAVALPGIVDATVTDDGLADLLGPTVHLQFDMPGWWAVRDAHKSVRIYLRGNHRKLFGGRIDQPLLTSFRHGEGTVIFTSFHNHKQLTGEQDRLLEFLVLRPVTARASAEVDRVLAAGGYRTLKETVHKLSAGGTSDRYAFECAAGQRRHVRITPGGAGSRLLLRVYRPNGDLAKEAATNGDSEMCTVASSSGESLAYEVTAESVPYANFPFLVTVFADGVGAATLAH